MLSSKNAIFIAAIFSLFFIDSTSYADEKDVLKSLEKIKGNVEVGLTLRTYSELISNAQIEINILKRNSENTKFINAAEECLKQYKAGMAYWQMGNDMGNKRGPFDEGRNKAWHDASELLDKAYESL